MKKYTEFSQISSEGERAINARARVELRFDDENPNQVELDIEIEGDADQKVNLSYLFTQDDGGLSIKFIRTGDPTIDYALCVTVKVGANIGNAALDCYLRSQSWNDFYNCMKDKVPGIGINAARALLSCLGHVIGI